jgi:hypothetical protein
METIKEYKLRQLFKNRSNCYADSEDVVQAMDENCFIETIKECQQERSYSEEDMINFIEFVSQYYADDSMENSSIEELLEQFKNK